MLHGSEDQYESCVTQRQEDLSILLTLYTETGLLRSHIGENCLHYQRRRLKMPIEIRAGVTAEQAKADIELIATLTADLEAANETMKKQGVIIGDLSMVLRRMVIKHRRGKLDDDFCLVVLDYLQRKELQGNFLRAMIEKERKQP